MKKKDPYSTPCSLSLNAFKHSKKSNLNPSKILRKIVQKNYEQLSKYVLKTQIKFSSGQFKVWRSSVKFRLRSNKQLNSIQSSKQQRNSEQLLWHKNRKKYFMQKVVKKLNFERHFLECLWHTVNHRRRPSSTALSSC